MTAPNVQISCYKSCWFLLLIQRLARHRKTVNTIHAVQNALHVLTVYIVCSTVSSNMYILCVLLVTYYVRIYTIEGIIYTS